MTEISYELKDAFLEAIRAKEVLQVALYLEQCPELATSMYNYSVKNTMIMPAVNESSLEILELLIHKGADVTHKNETSHTALHSVMSMGKPVEWVKVMLENGADPNAVNAIGYTPFSIGLTQQTSHPSRFPEVVEYMLNNSFIDPTVGKIPYGTQSVAVMDYIETQLKKAEDTQDHRLIAFFSKAQSILRKNLEHVHDNDVEIERER